jgi:hypothetical protein
MLTSDFLKPGFPRLFSISHFWTFINVQFSKPKILFGISGFFFLSKKEKRDNKEL